MENLILTTALPYANGNLHIGHIYEAVLADIKSRTYKKIQKSHAFVSGADAHGSATTLYCQVNKLNIEQHLAAQHARNKAVYEKFDISFEYSRTNTELHSFVVNECLDLIWQNQVRFGKVFETRDVLSWFDEKLNQFLPDRYIKGTCPYCKTINQVEICDCCQKRIDNKDLLNPKSSVSEESVILKSSKHLVLNTKNFYEFVIQNKEIIPLCIRDFVLKNKNDAGYIDISREKPYYGIELNKDYIDVKEQCLYVWFDAPIGYITFAYEDYLKNQKLEPSKNDFRKFLKTIRFEHFIGKDIIYFHTFLWFNLLKHICGKLVVEKLNVHGWITQNNKKYSKRDGAQLDEHITARAVREYRLFFFSKYRGNQNDIELDDKSVIQDYTSFVINKFGNFYARSVNLLKEDEKFTLLTPQLNSTWIDLIDVGDYRGVYLDINDKITKLNVDFSLRELWKEKDRENVVEQLKIWLNEWNSLFQILTIVIPEFEKLQHKINRLEFFYLDKR